MSTEHSVGIKAFASPGDGFAAATKQRFSDFIVREVGLDGKVVRLTTLLLATATPAAGPTKQLERPLLTTLQRRLITTVPPLMLTTTPLPPWRSAPRCAELPQYTTKSPW